jgi:hypothetical protein
VKVIPVVFVVGRSEHDAEDLLVVKAPRELAEKSGGRVDNGFRWRRG